MRRFRDVFFARADAVIGDVNPVTDFNPQFIGRPRIQDNFVIGKRHPKRRRVNRQRDNGRIGNSFAVRGDGIRKVRQRRQRRDTVFGCNRQRDVR